MTRVVLRDACIYRVRTLAFLLEPALFFGLQAETRGNPLTFQGERDTINDSGKTLNKR